MKTEANNLKLLLEGYKMSVSKNTKAVTFFHRSVSMQEHSMEVVCNFNGVVFINDSIAINANKTYDSLQMIPSNIILIIGGIDTTTDYDMLTPLVKSKVGKVISVASDNGKINKAFISTGVELCSVNSITEAVENAIKYAKNGDVVLFSPACPSYHPFDNYKNRGNDFKRIVQSLIK